MIAPRQYSFAVDEYVSPSEPHVLKGIVPHLGGNRSKLVENR